MLVYTRSGSCCTSAWLLCSPRAPHCISLLAVLVQVDPGRPGALAVQVMVRLNASYDSCHFVTRRVHTLTQRGMLWHGAYVCLSVCPLRQLIDSVNQYIYNISPSAYHSNYIFCGDRLVDPRNHATDRGLNLQISN